MDREHLEGHAGLTDKAQETADMPTRGVLLITVAVALIVGMASIAPGVAGPLDAPGATKVFTCSSCHGANGNSTSASMPILAGMLPAYFKKSIQDYAAGKRPSPEMEPFAKMVIQIGIDDVAGYFAAQKREPTPVKVDSAAAARGKNAATTCATCHGADGKGDPAKALPAGGVAIVPALAGQPPGYLRNQMMLFKQDQRSPGDPVLRDMKAIMRNIPDQALDDLAAYYSSLK
jgi:cytochrome c553